MPNGPGAIPAQGIFTMQVIGISGDKKYICEVKHAELEKFLNLYYGHMNELSVGQEVDLGKGYDHAREIKAAFDNTRAFIDSNQKVVNAIMNGLSIIGERK
jgi:hypothetical protein